MCIYSQVTLPVWQQSALPQLDGKRLDRPDEDSPNDTASTLRLPWIRSNSLGVVILRART